MDFNQVKVILKNIRIHGLGDIVDSSWFEIGNNLTYMCLPADFNRTGFMEALQSVNPPFSCEETEPFKDYPRIFRQGKYQKRVRPNKRTIAFTIFTAQAAIVKELAEITPILYETDRIEVGRRLDYSRWINFVEIASSTRWSEIHDSIMELISKSGFEISVSEMSRIESMDGTDRVIGYERELLEKILNDILEEDENIGKKTNAYNILEKINREVDFRRAKELVARNLPIFFIINSESLKNIVEGLKCFSLEENVSQFFSKSFVEAYGWNYGDIATELASISKIIQLHGEDEKDNTFYICVLQAIVECCAYCCQKLFKTIPIFLIDEVDLSSLMEKEIPMRKFLSDISKNYQCISFAKDDETIEADDATKIIRLKDLLPDER